MTKQNEGRKVVNLTINGGNGHNFSNMFNDYSVSVRKPLEDLNKWELRRLYKANEKVQQKAEEQYKKEKLEEVENFLYKAIPDIINTLTEHIEQGEKFVCEPVDYFAKGKNEQMPNGVSQGLFALFSLLSGMLKNISKKDIAVYFSNNPKKVFDKAEYSVDNDFNLYEKQNEKIYKSSME